MAIEFFNCTSCGKPRSLYPSWTCPECAKKHLHSTTITEQMPDGTRLVTATAWARWIECPDCCNVWSLGKEGVGHATDCVCGRKPTQSQPEAEPSTFTKRETGPQCKTCNHPHLGNGVCSNVGCTCLYCSWCCTTNDHAPGCTRVEYENNSLWRCSVCRRESGGHTHKCPRRTRDAGTFTKHDTDKPRMDLLPPAAIEAVARVLTHGAKKYGDDNWRKGERHRYVAALLRHVFAAMRGERTDTETGESHWAHAACCALFLVELDG